MSPFRPAAARGDGIRARYGIADGAPLLFFHGTLHYWPNTEAVRFIAEKLLPLLLAERPDKFGGGVGAPVAPPTNHGN